MNNTLSLVILAAKDESLQKSNKQLNPVGFNGEGLVEYSIFDALEVGIKHIVFIVNQEFDLETKKYFQHIIEGNEGTVEFILQTTYTAVSRSIYDVIENRREAWGDAHELLIAKRHLSQPFIVIKSDEFYGRETFIKAKELIEGNWILPNRFGIISYLLKNTLCGMDDFSRNLCNVNDKYLENINEEVCFSISLDEEILNVNEGLIVDEELSIFTNFWLFHPSIFRSLEEQFTQFLKINASNLNIKFSLITVIHEMMKEDQLEILVAETDEKWLTIAEKDYTINYIQELIIHQKYPRPLWKS